MEFDISRKPVISNLSDLKGNTMSVKLKSVKVDSDFLEAVKVLGYKSVNEYLRYNLAQGKDKMVDTINKSVKEVKLNVEVIRGDVARISKVYDDFKQLPGAIGEALGQVRDEMDKSQDDKFYSMRQFISQQFSDNNELLDKMTKELIKVANKKGLILG